MAAEPQQQRQTIAAPFPAPPPFYKNFTKQNLTQLRQLRKEAASQPQPQPQPQPQTQTSSTSTSNGEQPSLDILSLPPELRYLIPPPLPEEGKYRTFGASIDLNAPEQTLQEAGIEQLYPPPTATTADGKEKDKEFNPQPHLLALTRSLLSSYLSLVGILSRNPTAPAQDEAAEGKGLADERIEDMQTIMFNIHDLINRYRPHQARESLVLMMEERVERMREETRRVEEAGTKVREVLRGLREQGLREVELVGQRLGDEERKPAGSRGVEDERRRRRQRDAWAAIEREVGDGVGDDEG